MKQANALIFGAAGQDGYYLSQLLEQHNVKVQGVSRSVGNWLQGDVADQAFVEDLIKALQPDYIFHLAANSTTRHSAAFEHLRSIEGGTLNILEACYQFSKYSRIFLSGSAVQFANDGDPIDEETPFAPLSPYAVARIGSTYMGRYYRSLGLRVYVGYFFNHDSPLRSSRHVNQLIVETVKRIAQGSNEKLEVGDINTRKEFNFAGDMVEAVWTLVNQELIFEAVLGCGKSHRIGDWVAECFALAGLDWENHTLEKPGFRAEYKQLVCNPQRISSLGWQPLMDMKGLARMMYNAL